MTDMSKAAQTILDLAEARLRNPPDLTPNTEHDLREIARLSAELLAFLRSLPDAEAPRG